MWEHFQHTDMEVSKSDGCFWVIVGFRFMECYDILCLRVPETLIVLVRRSDNLVFVLPFLVERGPVCVRDVMPTSCVITYSGCCL